MYVFDSKFLLIVSTYVCIVIMYYLFNIFITVIYIYNLYLLV